MCLCVRITDKLKVPIVSHHKVGSFPKRGQDSKVVIFTKKNSDTNKIQVATKSVQRHDSIRSEYSESLLQVAERRKRGSIVPAVSVAAAVLLWWIAVTARSNMTGT